jgi:GcrA cell cycle regulator
MQGRACSAPAVLGTRRIEGTAMLWTDERVERLKSLWAKGYSASQIADRLGGVTRNAVIGKLHRLKFYNADRPKSKRPKGSTMQTKAKPIISETKVKQRRPAPAIAYLLAERLPELLPTVETRCGVALLELKKHMCRWPIGDPKDDDFHFCCAPKRLGSSYCEEHYAISIKKTTNESKRFRLPDLRAKAA